MHGQKDIDFFTQVVGQRFIKQTILADNDALAQRERSIKGTDILDATNPDERVTSVRAAK
jgi:hypothetical protein